MPRRTHPKRKQRHVPPELKGSGKKRPKSYHHSTDTGDYYLEIDRRFREAEGGAAA